MDEIFIRVKETWGRLCDINTPDAALQFMSCTRVTKAISPERLSVIIFAVCVTTCGCDGSNPRFRRLFSSGYALY